MTHKKYIVMWSRPQSQHKKRRSNNTGIEYITCNDHKRFSKYKEFKISNRKAEETPIDTVRLKARVTYECSKKECNQVAPPEGGGPNGTDRIWNVTLLHLKDSSWHDSCDADGRPTVDFRLQNTILEQDHYNIRVACPVHPEADIMLILEEMPIPTP
jgi:hypothetical protein